MIEQTEINSKKRAANANIIHDKDEKLVTNASLRKVFIKLKQRSNLIEEFPLLLTLFQTK